MEQHPGTKDRFPKEASVSGLPERFPALDAALLALPGAEWNAQRDWGWDRYLLCGKMFAALCLPGKTHAPAYADQPLLTLKCDPQEAEFLCGTYRDVLPGFYMDKRNWISIRLSGDVPPELQLRLAEASYRLILSRLPKRIRQTLRP